MLVRGFEFGFWGLPGFVYKIYPETLEVREPQKESPSYEVHFLCLEMAQKKVEEVGAIFHNTVAVQSELYADRDSGKLAVYSIMDAGMGIWSFFQRNLRIV